MAMTRRRESSVAGKWRWASLVTACRTLSSIEPDTSPPCVWATGMFMYAAAIAVAIVSKRSATVTTTSGWRSSNTVGSSSSPSPVDFAIVVGFSPSMINRIVASGAKPSCVHYVDGGAEPLEEGGRGGDELELELGVRRDGLAGRS